MVKVAFTGSFDPIHIGHCYIAEQAKRLGFEVNIIIANNIDKDHRYSLDERTLNVRLLMDKHFPVHWCDAADIGTFIKSIGCKAIIRGVRDTKDFEYEQKIADYNREVNGLETIYIPSHPELRNVSSTKIRSTQNNT